MNKHTTLEDDSDAWDAQLQLEEQRQRLTEGSGVDEAITDKTLHLPTKHNKDLGVSKRHGSAEDRGSADSYYSRPFTPHYYVKDSYNSLRIELEPTDPGYKLYKKGYQEQVNRKDWG